MNFKHRITFIDPNDYYYHDFLYSNISNRELESKYNKIQ